MESTQEQDSQPRTIALEVTEWESGEVVETIDVSSKTESSVERVMRGLLTQMDRDRFGVREVSA